MLGDCCLSTELELTNLENEVATNRAVLDFVLVRWRASTGRGEGGKVSSVSRLYRQGPRHDAMP